MPCPKVSPTISRCIILSTLLILCAFRTAVASPRFFGPGRYGRRRRPSFHQPAHPSYSQHRRRVYEEAAGTFVPNEEEEEEDNDDYGLEGNDGQNDGEESIWERAGVRPWKLDMSPKFGKTSLSSKLVMANVAAYAMQVWKPGLTRFGAKRSDLILSGRELHRLITPVFLHGGVVHLMMNSYSLSNIGPEVERVFGPERFLATYLASGVAGNVLSAIRSPNPAVGASGAIFGLMGAYYVFLSRNERLMGSYARRGLSSVTGTVATNLAFGYFNPMIDNWGHIGGALGGAAMAYAFGPKLYVLGLPNGQRVIIDKPKYRLPKQIRSMMTKFKRKMKKVSQYQYQSDFSANPLTTPSRPFRHHINPSRNMLKPRSRWEEAP